jgi:hypothetical protein
MDRNAEAEFNHYHVVSICVECADIDIIAIARDEKGLTEFYDKIEFELENSAKEASKLGVETNGFVAKVLVPNKVLTITPNDGHSTAHVVVGVTHKCQDPYEDCCERQSQIVFKKMVNKLAEGFMAAHTRRAPTEDKAKKSTPKQDERARNILNSLDLPDDLFKGMN